MPKATARHEFGHRTNGDLNGYKGSNFEGGFRVPFIVRWPQRVAAGSESDQLITLAGMLATTAGFLNLELPDSAGADSFDLSPVMLGSKVDDPIRTHAILQTGKGALAFRQGDWKLRFSKAAAWKGENVSLSKSEFELYNLADDPAEQNDLSSRQPERANAMRVRLLKLLKKSRSR